MTVFIDTSALYALLSATDIQHAAAMAAWTSLRQRQETFQTSNYILLETVSLVSRRLGFQAVRAFQADFAPLLRATWLDEDTHERAVAAPRPAVAAPSWPLC